MLWWLTQQTLTAAALTGLAVGLCRLRRLSPAMRHALWLLVLVKLMTPPLVSWPWFPQALAPNTRAETPGAATQPNPQGLPQDRLTETVPVRLPADPPAEPAPVQPARSEAIAARAAGDREVPRPESAGPGERPPASAPEAADRQEQEVEPSEPPGGRAPWPGAWLARGILYLWLAGSLAVGGFQLVRILRFRRRLAEGRPAPAWLACELKQWAARLGVRAPAVLVLPGTGSPLLWSLGRPALLWPASLLGGLPSRCRDAVLIHELAHLRRRDHWVGWLQVLATCLWWWHPLFWYVRRQLRANAELACDAWVLWALPDGRRAYAEALIEVSERVSRLAAPVPALGMGGSRRDFERRLTMIMRETVPCRVSRGGLVALGALALVVLPAWSLAQDKKPEDNAVQKRLPVDDKQSLPDTGRRDERLPVQKPPRADNNATGIRAGASLVGARDANHVGAVSGADRDRRLAAVEQQLQALLNEVRSLRGGAVNQQQYRQALVDSVLRPTAGADKAPVLEGPDAKPVAGRDGVQVITLTRATYKLPQSRAAALSEFLREHVKVEMLDLKVRGNELTVTTTPEAQKAIGQLIRLMRTDEPAKKDYYEKKS